MKLEEVLPALRAGKKIRYNTDVPISMFDQLASRYTHSSVYLMSDNWSIVEEPATDEELAAAFEAKAEQLWKVAEGHGGQAYDLLYEAADMVRKRYVDPSWKVGK
jgi:hypothetical protein